MNKLFKILFPVVCVLTLLFSPELCARGGRGGGGRGGGGVRGGGRGGISHSRGGAGRTHRPVNRTPSMSRQVRSAPRPAQRPAARPGQQPSKGMARVQTPQLSRNPSRNTPSRSQIQQHFKDTGLATEGRLQRTQGERPDLGRPGKPGEQPGRPGGDRWQNAGDNIRDNVRDNYRHAEWWDNRAWRYATWAGVTGWLGWPYATGYYYDDGAWTTYSEEDLDTAGSTAQSYTPAQAETQTAAGQEWLPLGVFTLAQEGETAAAPNGYMELFVNKEGVLSGSYYNSTTEASYALEGLIDKESQRAAWKMAEGENTPILETGLSNLTQAQAPVKITFADGRTQDWLLVRLEQVN